MRSGSSAPEPLQCGHIIYFVKYNGISLPLYISSSVTLTLTLNSGPFLSPYYSLPKNDPNKSNGS